MKTDRNGGGRGVRKKEIKGTKTLFGKIAFLVKNQF